MQTKNFLLLAALTTGVTVTSAVLSPQAQAIVLEWNLIGVTFKDGGTATGSFTYDDVDDGNPATSPFSNVNIVVTGCTFGSQPPSCMTPGMYTADTGDIVVASSNAGILELFDGGFIEAGKAFLFLDFASNLNNIPGTSIGLDTSTSAYGVRGEPGSPNLLASGSVQAVPFESDVLPLMGATVLFGGAMWWKRRRAQANANLDFLGVESDKSA